MLVLGLTFKDNCPDLRNIRLVDVVEKLQDCGVQVDVHDPWANQDEARHEYGLDLQNITAFCDLKSVFARNQSDLRL